MINGRLQPATWTEGAATGACAGRVWHRYLDIDAFDASNRRAAALQLSDRERAELASWREPTRRAAWLLARHLGKRLIQEAGLVDLPEATIEILSRNAGGRSTRPKISVAGSERPWSISISHTARGVLVALCAEANSSIGVDLADCTPLSARFVRLWFTSDEQRWLSADPDQCRSSLVWAVKEALYKACNQGEGFSPRLVEMQADGTLVYRGAAVNNCQWTSWHVSGQLAVMARVARQPISFKSLFVTSLQQVATS